MGGASPNEEILEEELNLHKLRKSALIEHGDRVSHAQHRASNRKRPILAGFDHGPWKETFWSRKEIEYESDLEENDPLRPKLNR